MQEVQFPACLRTLLEQKYLSNRESTQPFSFTQDDPRALLNQPAPRAGQEEGSSGKDI